MPNMPKPTGINRLWASTGTKVDPGVSKSNTGWVVELPPYQTANWIENRQDAYIAHSNQHGIPEWDSETEYQGNLSYTQGSDGIIYKCLVTHTGRDPTNVLNSTQWRVAFEDFGQVAIVQSALTAHLNNYSTLAGISNLPQARTNLQVYSKTEGDTRYAYRAGTATQQFHAADATLPTQVVTLGQFATLSPAASESVRGNVFLATPAEVSNGTDTTKAVTPAGASSVYLKRADNLSNISDAATARTNLGLGTVATKNVAEVLQTALNLSDVPDKAVARANLGLTSTAVQPETFFLRTSLNLSDVPNVATARSNLGLTSLATTNPTTVMFKADNLAGLASVTAARSNLGLADSATMPSGTWLKAANNLSDLTSAAVARNNLGLSAAATMPVYGATAFDFTATKAASGQYILPNGMIEKWGQISIGVDSSIRLDFPVAFPTACYNFTYTIMAGYHQSSTGMQTFSGLDRTGCTIHNGDNLGGIVHYRAIGV